MTTAPPPAPTLRHPLALVCSTALLLVPLPAGAADHENESASLARMGLVPPETIAAHLDELGITPSQHERLRALLEGAEAQARPLAAEVEAKRTAFEQAISNTDVTPEAAEAAVRNLLDAEAALKALHLRSLVALRGELTPDQREQALALTREREPAAADAHTPGPVTRQELEAQAKRIQAAFDDLRIEPPRSLRDQGRAFLSSLEAGDLTAARRILEKVVAETGFGAATDTPDEPPTGFDSFAPGETAPDSLQARLHDVETKAAAVTWLPLLRQLAAARDALEQAKANQDADQVGQILTWAEQALGSPGSTQGQ